MKQEPSKIDELFKEKLQDYQSNPSPDSWKKISDRLSSEEKVKTLKTRRLVYSSIAASFVLFTAISLFLFLQKENTSVSQTSPSIAYQKNDTTKSPDTVIQSQENRKQTNKRSPEKSPVAPVIEVVLKEEKTTESKKEFRLPDGSRIVLNRNSSVKYSKNFVTDRTIYLSGEAFFDVKPDPKHAFVIHGNLSKTEVFGTSFTIRSYQGEKYDEINVATGKVSFSQTMDKGDKIAILAGNKGIVQEGSIEKSAISDVNYNAWLTEKIIFNNTRLKEVFIVLEKQYGVSVSTKNSKILNCQFTGVFEKSDINEILEVLSVSFSLSFNEENKNYILSGKGCR